MAKKKIKRLNGEIEMLQTENRRLTEALIKENFRKGYSIQTVLEPWWIHACINRDIINAIGEQSAVNYIVEELTEEARKLIQREVNQNQNRIKFNPETKSYSLSLGITLQTK